MEVLAAAASYHNRRRFLSELTFSDPHLSFHGGFFFTSKRHRLGRAWP